MPRPPIASAKTGACPPVTRLNLRLNPDPKRVIARLYVPGGDGRVQAIADRVMSLSDGEVETLLAEIRRDFGDRHVDLDAVMKRHFQAVRGQLTFNERPSPPRQLLMGAHYTMEYSLESVALFNPSIVPHPDQSGVGPNELRFIMSLRACGEGHISSIEFRSGVIDVEGEVTLDPLSRYVAMEKPVPDKLFEKYPFFLKLIEMGAYNAVAESILDQLGDRFTLDDLQQVIERNSPPYPDQDNYHETADNVLWLARSNYYLSFPVSSNLSERVIFPVSENESRGIEDARFVRFVHDDQTVVYCATYTAYNGFRILPQLIETPDFRNFNVVTLNGRFAQNKGMALFPRKIDGEYLMISRIDGENLYLMRSDNSHFWNEADLLRTPSLPWEYVQIGNCGSPIETDAGWLLLTHGVGAMRKYCIGALLLDLDDPAKVIGFCKEPLMVPTESERDGYVPNVVYSCGAIVHRDELFIPYAMSDSASSIAKVSLPDLLACMTD